MRTSKRNKNITKINKAHRQQALIECLLGGPKTIAELEDDITDKLGLDSSIAEATRNRDLRDLREHGYDIQLVYDEARAPKYVLRKTLIRLPCDTNEIDSVLGLIQMGIKIGLISNNDLENEITKLGDILGHKLMPFNIDSLRRLTDLRNQDLKQIKDAIKKHHSISFNIKQPSNSKIKSITGYPREIFIRDKFLYLSLKRKNNNCTYDWRDYRLDRFVPIKNHNSILVNKKDIDPSPLSKIDSTLVKIKIYPPLTNFFSPDIWGLEKIYSSSHFDLYEGQVQKPRFRIVKDFLALLPNVEIMGDNLLREEFNKIVIGGYRRIS